MGVPSVSTSQPSDLSSKCISSLATRPPAGSAEPTILIVDDVGVNRLFLRGMLKGERYRILEVRRASEALELLKQEKVDLVILDLVLPEMSGLDFCRYLKADRRTKLVPTLIITSVQGIENEIAGFLSGADEFLLQPLHPAVVRARIHAMLRNKAAIDTLEEAEAILFSLAQAVEKRDKTTGDHCHRLAVLSVALGQNLGLPQVQLQALYRGGYLHDIGKVAVPDSILTKTDPLTDAERTIMQEHPVKGEEICRPMRSLVNVLPIIRSHHERWDGSGYPDGLAGESIPLLARMLQLADIYDALTWARCYKPAYSHSQAIEIIDEETRKGWRDPELVAVFKETCTSARQILDTHHHALLDPMQRSLENLLSHMIG